MNSAFYVSPFRRVGIVENMAYDAILLHDYSHPVQARIRCYGWSEPGATFGYSQRWAEVSAFLADQALPIVRRLTGGGMVPHGADFTYALALPPAHPLYQVRAGELYRQVHEAVAACLLAFDCPAELQSCACREGQPHTPARVAGQCFQSAEPFDVVHAETRQKLAGAAMKRHRDGLLVQGSITLPEGAPLDLFERSFIELIASRLELPFPTAVPAQTDPQALDRWKTHFGDPQWNRKR
ncbi:MAG: hypothetical protein Q7P63_14910 [Verrucomicrobiota bacterium JB022]|nr:hypothetical protein [Verrucomicrobiota bacterium JB022]